MDIFALYLMSWIGTSYKWGGSDIYGIDCSHLAKKVLTTWGVQHPDADAQGLFDYFSDKARWQDYRPGALAFFGADAKHVEHVAVLVTPQQMIEARGGDHLTLTLEDAKAKGAYVEMTNIKHRSDLIAVIRPSYPMDIN
jgi:cell wall-associated NlpC family hydrolase